jgi:hypothetical protein
VTTSHKHRIVSGFTLDTGARKAHTRPQGSQGRPKAPISVVLASRALLDVTTMTERSAPEHRPSRSPRRR